MATHRYIDRICCAALAAVLALTLLFANGEALGLQAAAKAMGYQKIITYTLDTEPGASLRAAGWTCMGLAGGKRWTGKRCPAVDLCPPQMKLRYEKVLSMGGEII